MKDDYSLRLLMLEKYCNWIDRSKERRSLFDAYRAGYLQAKRGDKTLRQRIRSG